MRKNTNSLFIGLFLFTSFIMIGCKSDSDQNATVVTYNFHLDSEGWVARFADLPADHDPAFYQLASSHQPLPSGLPGYGLYIQGDNHSDDLFMFFKKHVEGLQPNTVYQLSILIDLATNVPAGFSGIGGSPGESVYVKAGATMAEPLVMTDNQGWLRMNIDKGNQSQGGKDMVVLGNIAHPALEADSGGEYKIKTLDETGQYFEAVTDGNGTLWFIVGTDSGFEGLTTLYYSQISFSLTHIVS